MILTRTTCRLLLASYNLETSICCYCWGHSILLGQPLIPRQSTPPLRTASKAPWRGAEHVASSREQVFQRSRFWWTRPQGPLGVLRLTSSTSARKCVTALGCQWPNLRSTRYSYSQQADT